MGICTLIAIVSCRQSAHFFQPTMVWSCGRIVVNDLLVVDLIDDKEFFGEVYDMFCAEDFDGEELWTEQGELLQCRPRPVFVPTPRWAEPKYDLASMTTAFICAPLHALRAAFGVVRSWLAPDCTSPTAICGEIPMGARPTSTHRASQALHSIMLDGRLIHRNEVDEECEWLGTDGEYAARERAHTEWLIEEGIIIVGEGVSSCEKERIDAGWEHPTDRHTGRNRNRMARDRSRQLARRIKQELLGC